MKTLYTLFVLVVVACTASAQTPFWAQTQGPFGGNVSQVSVDSTGNLFAMADNGIYRSSDNGSSWTRSADIPTGVTFVTFAIARNGHYFAGSANGGVFRSTDGGIRWESASEGLPQSFAWAIAANPVADEVLVATGPGIYRTTDDGATWALSGNTSITRPIVFAPDGTAFAASGAGVMRSSDPARATWTWTEADSTVAPSEITALRIVGADTLWAGTEMHGAFISTDAGATWEARNTGLTSLEVVALDRGRAEELWISTRDGGLHRSTDHGVPWVRVNPGSTQFTSASTIRTSADRVFVASVKGLFYSDAHAIGVPWNASRNGFLNSVIRTVIVGPQSDLYAIQYTGTFHRSTDEGATWTITDLDLPPDADVTAMAIDSSGRLIASVRRVGLFASTDRGDRWERFGTTLPTERPLAVAVGSGNRIFVSNDSGQVFSSTDNGTTWRQLFAAESPAMLGSLVVRGQTVLAAGEQLFARSSDGGETWQIGGPRAYSLAFAPDGTVYAGSFIGRVYRSTDLGATWGDPTSTSSSVPLIPAIAVNASGHVIAGAQPGGIFISRDRGATWTRQNDGLVNIAITSIALDAGGRAYVGTYGGGVHRSIDPISGVAREAVADGATMRIAGEAIEVAIDRRATVRVDVVDMTGARVLTLHAGSLSRGAHRFTIDPSAMPPGAYVVRSVIDGAVAARLKFSHLPR